MAHSVLRGYRCLMGHKQTKPNMTAPWQIEKQPKISPFLALSFLDCFHLSFSSLLQRFSPCFLILIHYVIHFSFSAKNVARKEACNVGGREVPGLRGVTRALMLLIWKVFIDELKFEKF